MLRIAGHALKHRGRLVYDAQGNYDPQEATHGKCQCGQVFRAKSARTVRQTHRKHKQQIIRESGGAA